MSKLYKNREHQREIKRNESVTLYEDEKIKVIVPLTHQVSRIYGSGTKWCSSIGHFGEFERYSSCGVSYYILYKGISQGTSHYKVAAFKPFENKLPFIIFSPSVDSYIDKLSNKELLKDKYEDGGDFIRGSEEFSKYYLDLGVPNKVHYIKKLTTDMEFFLSDDASSIVDWELEPRIYKKMMEYYNEKYFDLFKYAMKKKIFNVIDVWDTTGKIEWARRRVDPFAKYLSDILLYYQELGAHINVSLPPGQASNSNFKVIPNSYINDRDELKEYIDNNELDELIICGIHLFACVHNSDTGYYSMVELFENTKIAVTLTQPMKPISLANEWCYY